jgi:hypothetical protein
MSLFAARRALGGCLAEGRMMSLVNLIAGLAWRPLALAPHPLLVFAAIGCGGVK